MNNWSSTSLGSSGSQCSIKHVSELCPRKGKEAGVRRGVASRDTSGLLCLGCSPSQRKATEREMQMFAAVFGVDRYMWPDVSEAPIA